MGWASGSELAEDIWDTVRNYIPKPKRKKVAQEIIQLFEYQDCDTIEEAELLCQDAGIKSDTDYYEDKEREEC